MLSCIRKKHGILVDDEDVEVIIMNTDDSEDNKPSKVSHPLKLTERPNIVIQQVKRPIQFLNVHHKPQHAPTETQVSMPQQAPSSQLIPREQLLGKRLRISLPKQVPQRVSELNPQLLPNYQQYDANTLIIQKSNTHVQKHMPSHSNKVESENL
ncbi:uncharacterized protein LOC112590985 [Melanaphis sacchari]|uniref:uncharacterized protein LOC112590985 n=1 Tax=Melanaphis sacchari TaxID=742174 RepID=UPI000DC154F9|nr:uncharacterized protein LOC112590985 [Melanaphis sacchari]